MRRLGVVLEPSDIPGCQAVFNPAVHRHENEDRIYLLCRLINKEGVSEIRRVVLNLNYKLVEIAPEPLLTGSGDDEQLGCEDPRVVEIEAHRHLITYTAVRLAKAKSGSWITPWMTRIGLAVSENLENCQRLGLFLPELGDNKDGVFLPDKVNGFYFLYHRIYPNVWLTNSADLKNWGDSKIVMNTRPGWWDSERIGIGTVLPDDEGWLAFYHGTDQKNVYRMGAALFDRNKPDKLLARSEEPLLEPQESYEKIGIVPNVVFICGAFSVDSRYIVFYGAADLCTAAAELTKKEVFQNLKPVHPHTKF